MKRDIRLSVDIFDSPKVKRLLRTQGEAGFVSLIRLWTWAAKFYPKGALTCSEEDIHEIVGSPEMLTALVLLGFVDVDEHGLHSLHDWTEHQGWVVNSEERSRIASENAKKRWCRPLNVDAIGNANGKKSVQRVEGLHDSHAPSPSPSPNPSAASSRMPFASASAAGEIEPSEEEKAASRELLREAIKKLDANPPVATDMTAQELEERRDLLLRQGEALRAAPIEPRKVEEVDPW